eukprot:scaffold103383_cov63-Phaeocystis_antarctica.AAC.2
MHGEHTARASVQDARGSRHCTQLHRQGQLRDLRGLEGQLLSALSRRVVVVDAIAEPRRAKPLAWRGRCATLDRLRDGRDAAHVRLEPWVLQRLLGRAPPLGVVPQQGGDELARGRRQLAPPRLGGEGGAVVERVVGRTEGEATRDENIGEHPHRPHVGGEADGLGADHLGRRVERGAHGEAAVHERVARALLEKHGRSEVSQLDLVVGRGATEDILGLHIAMDDVATMQVHQGVQELRHDALRARLAALLARQPPLPQHLIQDVPRPYLLHDIEGVADLRRADEAHDIAVTLCGAQRFDLAARSGLSLWCVCQDSLAGGVPPHLVLHLVNLCETTHPNAAAQAPPCRVTARRFVKVYYLGIGGGFAHLGVICKVPCDRQMTLTNACDSSTDSDGIVRRGRQQRVWTPRNFNTRRPRPPGRARPE